MPSRTLVACALALLCVSFAVHAQSAAPFPFSDIPKDSALYPAVEYLLAKNIIQPGSFFRPGDRLTRAQAAKILIAPLVSPDQLRQITESQFADVPSGQWFVPCVEAARALGLVDAAPAFRPNDAITKAAFITMLLRSKGVNPTELFGDLQSPLASDVTSTTDWQFPCMRYAVAASMIAVARDGTLGPSKELTRGDMALLVFRYDMYKQGRRTQALLSQAETDIANVMEALKNKATDQAAWAAARSVLASRGALAAHPDPLVKGAVKVSEGFQEMIRGYVAGSAGNFDAAIAAAKSMYALAGKARAFKSDLGPVATQMESIAKTMADEARKQKGVKK